MKTPAPSSPNSNLLLFIYILQIEDTANELKKTTMVSLNSEITTHTGYRRIRHWRDTFFHTDTLPEEWVETIIMHSQSNLSIAINCSFIVVFLFLKKPS